EPLTPPVVRMYTCGPTVYDFAHIGNFRSFLFADVLRRTLELVGLEVRHVMNITDVGHMTEDDLADGGGEDKMQAAAKKLVEAKKQGQAHAAAIDDPNNPYQIADFYTKAFLEDGKKLGLKVASEFDQGRMPKATDNIDEMLAMIGKLVEKGHAYKGEDGAVYFGVETFDGYGKLSGNSVEQLRGGAGGRVGTEATAAKRHPADFLLWKPDATHLMKWPSDFGEGYPGWHIECSAMARRHLDADVIDFHTGGEDNIFPHHECEIAQSCCATGQDSFAKFWLHGRHLRVEGEKMSKSKGNFFTVRDVLDGRATGNEVAPEVLRYELIRSHYRGTANFTASGLRDSGSAVAKLQKLHADAASKAEAADVSLDVGPLPRFVKALCDDLNVAAAVAAVFEWSADPGDDAATTRGILDKVDSVLGFLPDAATPVADSDIANLAAKIDAARAAKDFATADAIRADLLAQGYKVLTTKAGTTVEKPLA
ncbi:MAG: cysteine--tRNA ligase, partial [Planctomycetota bacterium]